MKGQNEMNKQLDKSDRPQIGISSCLLGNPVRFDGGHKNNKFIVESLQQHMNLIAICPEAEAGFGIPRPAIQLRNEDKTAKTQNIRLVVSRDSAQDLTGQMNRYISSKMPALSDLDGFIFKKNSPSCGLFRVPVVMGDSGYRSKDGVGLFAAAFNQRYPLIPVEEEGRLNDKVLRENFFERVYAYRRWRLIPDAQENLQEFYKFHSRHKLMLMARGGSYYQELGQMVAGTTIRDLPKRREAYIQRFMQIMSMTSRRGREVNVLLHIMGYLKKTLNQGDKQELLSVFEAYRQNQIPLITPITLLRHYLRQYPHTYINQQHYLKPYPEQLALRSFH